ncbi:hypothetical protein [Parapedobacter koreensis]|uniref:DUF4843 domain-containing protein n=1 Tax=Parapedobacter koreensis TaxID=332977 RepID=A0A1H7SNM2_9SPHI|nr:hypothetical protein [Parapedobacter koreensis]SEL74251.1 hypothetical protein SAMN05421740_10999 [Parapedobacter koreensis]
MKTRNIFITLLLLSSGWFFACEDKDYPAGLPEYEHHYYIVYVPNNNSGVTINRTQTDLVKFPVQFYSEFTRNYDAVAHYAVVTPDVPNPAVLGEDFQIVDRDGNTIQPNSQGKFSLTFPQARKATDTVYVKLLNNPEPGSRVVEINFEDHITPEYRVDIFSTAFRRTLTID